MKESTIALQRDAEVFGGYLIAAIPLFFELGAFLGENFCQAFHRRGDEAVSLLDGWAGLVNESYLNVLPAISQVGNLVVGEQRNGGSRIANIGCVVRDFGSLWLGKDWLRAPCLLTPDCDGLSRQ